MIFRKSSGVLIPSLLKHVLHSYHVDMVQVRLFVTCQQFSSDSNHRIHLLCMWDQSYVSSVWFSSNKVVYIQSKLIFPISFHFFSKALLLLHVAIASLKFSHLQPPGLRPREPEERHQTWPAPQGEAVWKKICTVFLHSAWCDTYNIWYVQYIMYECDIYENIHEWYMYKHDICSIFM